MSPLVDQQVRLLGSVDVRIAGVVRPIAGTRRKAVLAALALSAGHAVRTDALIDMVWSGQAPATAANTLQSHVSFLRGLFPSRNAIVGVPAGYRLDLGEDATDLRVAERLLSRAAAATDAAERVKLLRSALALWRSRALAELSGLTWFEAQAERIERLRADAFGSLVDARLNLGEHVRLVAELEDLVRNHPFDEALHARLMLALYRSGRQADAFEVYRTVRSRLLDELGIDPGRALRDLETAMLRQDPSLDLPAAPVTMTTPLPVAVATPIPELHVVPAQLPPALPQFVGRQHELELLDEALASDAAGRTAMICAVSGPPGVGKTSLAVAWAHRVAPLFPDGQLYVNLRGFDPQATLEPDDVLHGFLEALGVPVQRIPDTLTAKVGLYRSVLSGKRVLVLLDNAHDAEHVRPLLPGSAQCVAIVTSRNKLAPLVATEGAMAMPVELLDRPAAHALLAQRLGEKRTATEPNAVDDIISRCAGLPLALGIVAARAATEPAVSLATIASQMRAATDALDSLSGGDHSADVRVVISWSYAVLGTDAARLFRHLSVHPGAEMGLAAAASLAGLAIPQARRLLVELTGANLLIALDNERYTFHDLIRAFAAEQLQLNDSAQERSDAWHRLSDHYLHSAHAAAGLLDMYRDVIVPAAPVVGVVPVPLADHEQALAWLMVEYPALLAIIRQAGAAGFDDTSWQLACTLTEFFERRGLWHGWLTALSAALSAAQRLGDRRALAFSHRGLARAHQWLANYDEAQRHHRQALAHFSELGDRLGQARTWHSLGRLAELRGLLDEALRCTTNGLELFRAVDDRPGIAKALNGVGWYHCLRGDYQEALRCCGDALVLLQELGDRRVEANTWDSLGYAHRLAGDFVQAIDCYHHALLLFRDIGDTFHEGNASDHLGDAYAEAGDAESARETWQRALAIFDDLGHSDAQRVRAKLA